MTWGFPPKKVRCESSPWGCRVVLGANLHHGCESGHHLFLDMVFCSGLTVPFNSDF